jgi:hypothetical protein
MADTMKDQRRFGSDNTAEQEGGDVRSVELRPSRLICRLVPIVFSVVFDFEFDEALTQLISQRGVEERGWCRMPRVPVL